jgi:plasmid stabilization system protein ParE
MRSISFAVPAQDDVRSLHHYIASDNPAAASRLVLRIRELSERLRDFPDMGRLREDLPTSGRLRSIGCKPYVIFYVADENHVEIVRVIHMSMDIHSSELE